MVVGGRGCRDLNGGPDDALAVQQVYGMGVARGEWVSGAQDVTGPGSSHMSNLLSIPSKKTYSIDVREAARNHIYARGGGHPDEFKDDIALWQNLRKGAVGDVVHVDRINALLLSVQNFVPLPEPS